MIDRPPQFQNNLIYSPNDTQRDMVPNRKPVFSPDLKSQTMPGTKSLHLYNTLLFVFNAVQIGLYASQAVNAACSQRNFCSKISWQYFLRVHGCLHIHHYGSNYSLDLHATSKRIHFCYSLHNRRSRREDRCRDCSISDDPEPCRILLCYE